MKMIKKTSLFSALLLLTATFNPHKTHTMEPTGWVALAGATILGGYAAYKQFLLYIHNNTEGPFTSLPQEIQQEIIGLLAATINTEQKFDKVAQSIRALAVTNKSLNALINEPQFCLKIIKHYAKKNNCSDEMAAQILDTQEAKKRLKIQEKFKMLLFTAPSLLIEKDRFNEKTFNDLYTEYKDYVDLNFIYNFPPDNYYTLRTQPTTLFPVAIKNDIGAKDSIRTKCLLNTKKNLVIDNYVLIDLFIKAIINRNIPLIQLLCDYKIINQNNINITPQAGHTQGPIPGSALYIAALSNDNLDIIKILLDAGANPELPNPYNSFTPLQVAEEKGNQEIIDLMKKTIGEKRRGQGK